MISNEVHANRPLLKAALEALGGLDALEVAVRESSWKAPHVSEGKDRRFSDPWDNTPLWISDKDAATYFGLHNPTLTAAGVHLVGNVELNAYTGGASLFSPSGGRKRWLYPVFACAERFGTPPGAARQALQAFLSKNKRRESEIMSELGLGCVYEDNWD